MESSDFKHQATFRLQQRSLRKYYETYHVTITPRGKGQTHRSLWESFGPAILKYKSVQAVFLIAEVENTNHFHGVIYTKGPLSFKRLYTKKQKFTVHMSRMPLTVWINYMLKREYTKQFYVEYIAPQKLDIHGRLL